MKLLKIQFGQKDIDNAHAKECTVLETINFTKLGVNKFGKDIFKNNVSQQCYSLLSWDTNSRNIVLVETNVKWKLAK